MYMYYLGHYRYMCGCDGISYVCANQVVDRYKEWLAFKDAAPRCLLPDLVDMIGEYI